MMNPLRDRRLWEVRKRLHTHNLDLGAGSYPITSESVTLDSQPGKHPDFEQNILEGIPFPDSSFDSVTALEFLEHFEVMDQLKILAEIYRIVERGGQIIFTIPYSWGPMKAIQELVWFVRSRTTQKEYYLNGHTHGHIGLVSPQEFQNMVRHAGFKIKEARRLMLYDFLVLATKP